jgi:hypothetical protein
MRPTAKWVVVAVSISIFASCAPSRFVKPLQKKEQAVSFSLGGPVIKYSGAPVPMPFTTLAYGRGLTEKITCFGSLHTTSLLFGNLQSDIGSTFLLVEKPGRRGLSATPALQVAYNMGTKNSFRIWPSTDLNGWIHLKESPSYVYGGVDAWFEPSGRRAHDQPQSRHVIPNIHTGIVLAGTKWNHQLQVSYLGAGIPNLPGVVDYVGIGGKGTVGFHYSILFVIK